MSAGETAPGVAAAAAYTISELAREFAVTTRAIRFDEDEGLLAPQRRGRVRVYGERERVRIKCRRLAAAAGGAKRGGGARPPR